MESTLVRTVLSGKTYPTEHDETFRKLGATHRYDETYPGRVRRYDGIIEPVSTIFARYYFNAIGGEIGYVIPDISNKPHIHPTPRVWGIPHILMPF